MKTSRTGTTNQYGLVGRLQRMVAEKEADAAAARRTLAMFLSANGHNGKAHAPSVMADALKLDEQRRAKVARPSQRKSRPHTGKAKATTAARRLKTLQFLDRVKQSKGPFRLTAKDIAVARVVKRYGYIRPEGDGFVRTDKPFSVEKR